MIWMKKLLELEIFKLYQNSHYKKTVGDALIKSKISNPNSNSVSKTLQTETKNDPTNNNNSMISNTTSSTPSSFVSHMKGLSDLSNIEMIQMATYTSLRDLILPSPPSLPLHTAVGSLMAAVHNSSWHEDIPIKNPLVKHAAIAYLQPMSTSPRKCGGKAILRSIMENCGCCDEGIGCMVWVYDVVKNAFGVAGAGGIRSTVVMIMVSWLTDDHVSV